MNARTAAKSIVATIIFTGLTLLLFFVAFVYAGQAPKGYPAGTYTIPFSPNDKVKSVSVVIDRTFWTQPTITADATLTINTNSTWRCRLRSAGDGPGVNSLTTTWYCPLPPGTKRTVTATIIIAGGTLQVNVDPSFSTKE